ncbi:MAG: CAP domain-containing protein [Aquisalimonadaceae bacterium]
MRRCKSRLTRFVLLMGAMLLLLVACEDESHTQTVRAGLEAREQGALRADMLVQINEARASSRYCGKARMSSVPPVVWNDRVAEAAQDYATVMANRNWFDHTGPDGSTPETRLRATGYRPQAWGENIAAGQTSVDAVVRGWLDSPNHCVNIMNPKIREIGAGLALAETDSGLRRYWTLLFASPMGVSGK